MRIYHIVTEIPLPEGLSGGMGVHVWNLTREQAKLGHEVIVFANIRTTVERDGVRFEPLAFVGPHFDCKVCHEQYYSDSSTEMIYSYAKQNGIPDLIHCHEWDSAKTSFALRTYLNRPVIGTLHISNIINMPHMTKFITADTAYFAWWEQRLMRESDGLIAISEYFKGWVEFFRQRNGPIKIIPNGVKIEDFQSDDIVIDRPSDKLLCFFHGRLAGQKGIDIIIEAAKQRDDIYWVLAGPMAAEKDGRCLEDNLLRELWQLRDDGKILMPGMLNQKEIGAWLRACDVAVYPHHTAPFDCAVLEAMACGALVVTTGVDAIGEYAFDGVNCRYCRPTADSLLDTIDSALKLNSYCKINARKVAEDYTWKNTTKKTVEFYKEILHGKNSTEPRGTGICNQDSRFLLDGHPAQ